MSSPPARVRSFRFDSSNRSLFVDSRRERLDRKNVQENMCIDNVAIETLRNIRRQAPLVHNITNFVVMNSSANILLAVGASPVMAHCLEEVKEMTSVAAALVINIGTLQPDWIEAMILAAKTANAVGIPVVLDPVGAGATRLRTDTVKRIMQESAISVLRGNASEVFSISGKKVQTKGVDSTVSLSREIIDAAGELALQNKCVIAISGPEDFITDGSRSFSVQNGQPLMTRITGTGCGLSAVTAAFCAVSGTESVKATTAAFAFYGLCGDLAIKTSTAPGSFAVAFIDRLYTTGSEEITAGFRVRER